MKFFYKLERKYGKYAIPNLMQYIVVLYGAGLIISLWNPWIYTRYLALNGKTQMITPTLLGEMIFDVVSASIKQLLNPDLTASWEKGLTYVAEGTITPQEYMDKLERFVAGRTYNVLRIHNQYELREYFDAAAKYYK